MSAKFSIGEHRQWRSESEKSFQFPQKPVGASAGFAGSLCPLHTRSECLLTLRLACKQKPKHQKRTLKDWKCYNCKNVKCFRDIFDLFDIFIRKIHFSALARQQWNKLFYIHVAKINQIPNGWENKIPFITPFLSSFQTHSIILHDVDGTRRNWSQFSSHPHPPDSAKLNQQKCHFVDGLSK